MPIFLFKLRFEVIYHTIDDVVFVRDINSPTGQSIVSIIIGEKEIEINSFTNAVGELNKGFPVMAIRYDGTTRIIVVRDTIENENVTVIVCVFLILFYIFHVYSLCILLIINIRNPKVSCIHAAGSLRHRNDSLAYDERYFLLWNRAMPKMYTPASGLRR